jgi:organic hydroperoxide reductase OsmC/OhrA
MKPLPHLYEVILFDRLCDAPSRRSPLVTLAPPKDFDGPGELWSPEYLLLAAVEACFMFTFRAVAQASKFDFVSLDLSGNGTVDRRDGVTRFTEIVLRPQRAENR